MPIGKRPLRTCNPELDVQHAVFHTSPTDMCPLASGPSATAPQGRMCNIRSFTPALQIYAHWHVPPPHMHHRGFWRELHQTGSDVRFKAAKYTLKFNLYFERQSAFKPA